MNIEKNEEELRLFRLNHNDAVELEHHVRRLYNCDRGGVSGLVDADHFEGNPMCAAYMVISYIYAKDLAIDNYQFDQFICTYEHIFNHYDEYDIQLEIKRYIDELSYIVDQYI